MSPEHFLAKRSKGNRIKYRRFATAAEAIRYAVEDLRTLRALGAWMEVGDERYGSDEIHRLYPQADEDTTQSRQCAQGWS